MFNLNNDTIIALLENDDLSEAETARLNAMIDQLCEETGVDQDSITLDTQLSFA